MKLTLDLTAKDIIEGLGSIEPSGDLNTDLKRFDKLLDMMNIVDLLLLRIEKVASLESSPCESEDQIISQAKGYIQELKESL